MLGYIWWGLSLSFVINQLTLELRIAQSCCPLSQIVSHPSYSISLILVIKAVLKITPPAPPQTKHRQSQGDSPIKTRIQCTTRELTVCIIGLWSLLWWWEKKKQYWWWWKHSHVEKITYCYQKRKTLGY